MQGVELAIGPALATGAEGALVAKAQLAVLGPCSSTLGTNLAKAQRLGQTTDPYSLLVGLEVGEWIVRVWH